MHTVIKCTIFLSGNLSGISTYNQLPSQNEIPTINLYMYQSQPANYLYSLINMHAKKLKLLNKHCCFFYFHPQWPWPCLRPVPNTIRTFLCVTANHLYVWWLFIHVRILKLLTRIIIVSFFFSYNNLDLGRSCSKRNPNLCLCTSYQKWRLVNVLKVILIICLAIFPF